MFSPKKFANRTGTIGKPLPVQFRTWEQVHVEFRHGATSMIAGTPGSFKSVLALNMAAWWARQKLSVLYFSADSDEFTVCRRLAGIVTGDAQAIVESRMSSDPHAYDTSLAQLGDLEFVYDQLSLAQIEDHLKAYEAVSGGYPDAVFIDNLIDYVEFPDDYGGMITMIRDFDSIARQTKSHICVLHHCKLRTEDKRAGWPPADWEITGKVTQKSRLVITVAADERNLFWSPVKNTNGPPDRLASVRYGFYVEESMRVRDTGFRGSE